MKRGSIVRDRTGNQSDYRRSLLLAERAHRRRLASRDAPNYACTVSPSLSHNFLSFPSKRALSIRDCTIALGVLSLFAYNNSLFVSRGMKLRLQRDYPCESIRPADTIGRICQESSRIIELEDIAASSTLVGAFEAT